MEKFDELLDEIHEIREDLFNKTKDMSPEEEAKFYNREAKRLLKEWGIELKSADYLLEAVSGKK